MSGRKAGRKPGTFAKGHDARRNTTKPGPGRPPDEFKEMCQRLASKNATANRVARILKDEDHPFFISALKWATENGYGRAKETVEVSGPGGKELVVRFVKDARAS